jgi:hypothetical protein
MEGSADVFLGKFDGNGNSISSRNIIVSIANGAWGNPATWAGGIVPGTNDIVKVVNAVTVTTPASCYSLSVTAPTGSITLQTGNTLSVLH